MDDVLVSPDGSLDDHREKVREEFKRLDKACLTLDIDKSEFEVKTTRYLGKIINAATETQFGLVAMDPEMTKPVLSWKPPHTLRQLRQILGFSNYYRRFIPSYTTPLRPLQAYTRTDAAKNLPWSPEDPAQKAFDSLKQLRVSSTVLQAFDFAKPATIVCDSSNFTTGAVLKQPDSQKDLKLVGYYSKPLSFSESRYEIYDKELLAIVHAFTEWPAELLGSPEKTQIVSEHRNLP